jgi:hypothetical protein
MNLNKIFFFFLAFFSCVLLSAMLLAITLLSSDCCIIVLLRVMEEGGGTVFLETKNKNIKRGAAFKLRRRRLSYILVVFVCVLCSHWPCVCVSAWI